MSVNDSPLLGVAPERMPALLAALCLSLLLPLMLRTLRRACGRGSCRRALHPWSTMRRRQRHGLRRCCLP
jgi:hypothetical protein